MHFDAHFDKWNKKSYIVNDWRIMLIQWIEQIWKEFHDENNEIIRRAFRKLGLFLTMNESKNDQLHVEDLSDIKINNWRRLNEMKNEMKNEMRSEANEGINKKIDEAYEYVLNDEIESEKMKNVDNSDNNEMNAE